MGFELVYEPRLTKDQMHEYLLSLAGREPDKKFTTPGQYPPMPALWAEYEQILLKRARQNFNHGHRSSVVRVSKGTPTDPSPRDHATRSPSLGLAPPTL